MESDEITRTNEQILATFLLLKPEITRIIVSFDGSGDSGQIESVEVYSGDDTITVTDNITVWKQPGKEFDNVNKKWTEKEAHLETVSFTDFVHSFVDDLLEDSNVDWYNNDGGYGNWEWSRKAGMTFDVYQRETTSNLAYSADRALGDFDNEEQSQEAA